MIIVITHRYLPKRYVEDAAAFVADGFGNLRICRDGQADEYLSDVVSASVVPS